LNVLTKIFIYIYVYKRAYDGKRIFFAYFNLESGHQPKLMMVISKDQSNMRNFTNWYEI